MTSADHRIVPRAALAAALIVLAGACNGGAEVRGAAEVAGPATVDFGRYRAIERKVARYRVRNAGKGILRILKVRKTCGCASATASRTELQPGEESAIKVVILPSSIFGPFSKNTYVETDDPKNRFVRLTVAGDAVPLVRVLPKAHVHAGRLKEGQEWSHSFSLEPTEGGVELADPRTKASCPAEAKLHPSGGAKGAWRLDVKVAPDGPGDFRCDVSVPVIAPSNHPPVKVSVSGRSGAELAAVPGIAYLSVSEEPQARNIRFHVMGQRSRALKPEELAMSKAEGVSLDAKQDRNGRWLLVRATFSPEFSKQLYADERIPLSFSVPGASSATVVCKIRK